MEKLVEDTIKKFSEYILKFRNDNEIYNFFKKNCFKINEGNIGYFVQKYDGQLSTCHLENFKKGGLKKRKFRTLSSLYYSVLVLEKEGEKRGLIPLDKFINGIKYKNLDKDKLFAEMQKSGHFFLCWNQEFMYVAKKRISYSGDLPKISLTDIKKNKYRKKMAKAMSIYNVSVWGSKRRLICLTQVSVNKDELNLSIRKKNNIISIKINDLGQITGYGVICNPQSNTPLPKKRLQRINEAIKLFKDAIVIWPRNYLPYKFLARTYQSLRIFDEAIKYFKLAKDLRPNEQEIEYRINECEASKKGTSYFVVNKNHLG